MSQFEGFPKVPRWSRAVLITEKIDGTNGQIYIADKNKPESIPEEATPTAEHDNLVIFTGSRTRWIHPGSDNYGFAGWVREHSLELRALGPGRHYGEWWGLGIQRGYGKTERTFSLFNVSRWSVEKPACCEVVPVLYKGILQDGVVDSCCDYLRVNGSQAKLGFPDAEGIMIFHYPSNTLFKKTLVHDESPKALVPE